MQLAPNDLLQGRYRVQALIAQGGMGAVYRAVDERLGNTVALKQTLMADPQLRAAFEREARLLAGLHHPALPVVSDHFSEGDGQFLVMQFIPGEDLASMLAARGGPFALAQVLPWADRLLDALDYLHTQQPPVIHRDLKPQNLKLTPRGEIVLLDFGLAKGQLGGSAAGAPSLFGYTPQYAPIEQIQGSGTDPRSDLYAFGATLYQLLTGHAPPDALTRAAALVAGQPDPLRPAHELSPQLPAALGALLQRTMAQAAGQRPASAAELRRELQRAAAAPAAPQTLVAVASSSAGQPTITMPRPAGAMRWRLIGAAAALSAAVLVAAAFFLLQMLLTPVANGPRPTSAGAGPRPSPSAPAPRDTVVLVAATTAPAEPIAGASRARPLPAGATADIGSWAVLITGTSRGDAAWELLHETNSLNDPAPAGREYLIVHLRARALLDKSANRDLYPRVTGDRLALYAPEAAVVPHPRPEQYAAGDEFDIDVPYLVEVGEGNLILYVDDLGGSDATAPAYLAIDQGARITVDQSLREIKATPLGADMREPAGLGETVVTDDFEVTVRQLIRGDEAYQRLLEANKFNDPPEKGREYLLAFVEVRSISTKDETAMVDGGDFFTLVADAADPPSTAIRHTAAVEPDPELSFYLYPGGRAAGWVAVEVPKDAPNVRLGFTPSFGLDDTNVRYFSIE